MKIYTYFNHPVTPSEVLSHETLVDDDEYVPTSKLVERFFSTGVPPDAAGRDEMYDYVRPEDNIDDGEFYERLCDDPTEFADLVEELRNKASGEEFSTESTDSAGSKDSPALAVGEVVNSAPDDASETEK